MPNARTTLSLVTLAAAAGLTIQVGGQNKTNEKPSDAKPEAPKPEKKRIVFSPEAGALICQDWQQNFCRLKTIVQAPEPVQQQFQSNLRGRSGKFFAVNVRLGSDPQSAANADLRPATLEVEVVNQGWLRELPLEGTFKTADASGEWARQMKLVTPRPSLYEWPLFSGSLLGALAAAAWVAFRLPGQRWRARMGLPAWNASDSWCSNVTIGAGFVNGLLGLTVLSETVYCDRPTYQTLMLLFTLLIGVAPLLYNALRVRVPGAAGGPPVFEGYVGSFLAAGFFTLWGTFGQLSMLVLLFYELERAAVISRPTMWVLVLLGSGLLAALFVYGTATLHAAATEGQERPERDASGREELPGPRPAGWSLL